MKLFLLFVQGFVAKIIAGADDTLVHSPVIATLTKTRRGRLAFIGGMFTAIMLLIIGASFFAFLLARLPYRHLWSAGLLIILALLVFYNKIIYRGREMAEPFAKKFLPKHRGMFSLWLMGALLFLTTGFDDLLVYAPLLTGYWPKPLYVAFGILAAAGFELFIVYHFANKLAKFKHLERVTVAGLLLLALLVGLRII